MALDKHIEFIEELENVMSLAIDEGSDEQNILSEEEFFSAVYTEFDAKDEAEVKQAVEKANRFMIVVGPVGGGKSTLVRHALREAQAANSQVFVFDFKEHAEQFIDMSSEPDLQILFIRDTFREALAREFLEDIDVKVEFVFNALWLFFKEKRLHSRVLKWRAEFKKPGISMEEEEVRQYFSKDYNAIAEEEEFIRNGLTCAQMILALKRTLNVERFLLVLDNVDRLAVGAQPLLFSLALDIHHAGRKQFGTLVAVRKKNLMRYEEAGTDGNTIRVVSVKTKRKERLKPIRIHSPTPDFTRSLLQKRYSLVTERCNQAPPGRLAQSLKLFASIAPVVSTQFVEERFHNLSNHNYREMLARNCDFIEHLLDLADDGIITDTNGNVDLPGSEAVSYLYRWMCVTQELLDPFLLDVTSKYRLYAEGAFSDPLICDLEIMILAWLTNNERSFLRMGELVSAFRTIGASSDSVLDAVYRLYDTKLSNRHIELGDSEIHQSRSDLQDARLRVVLTPLGCEFVTTTMTRFEFMHQGLLQAEEGETAEEKLRTRIFIDIDKKVQRVFGFLKVMEEVHTASVLQIKKACRSAGYNFEPYYRSRFCVNGNLVLENTIRSHLAYLKVNFPYCHAAWLDEYKGLLDRYYKAIDSGRDVTKFLQSVT